MRAQSARGDNRDGYRFRERNGGIEIQSLEQSVARNVGIDDCGDAGVFETPGDFQSGKLRGFRPTFHRDLAVARVKADGDAAGKFLCCLFYEIRIAHCRGADDDARSRLC